MNSDSIYNAHLRIFPDPTKIRAEREANVDTLAVFQALAHEAKRAIKKWTDPEVEAFELVSTNNQRAAEMLIDVLRTDGYAADFHWHGHKSGCDKVVVQIAFAEADLQRYHHDPRR